MFEIRTNSVSLPTVLEDARSRSFVRADICRGALARRPCGTPAERGHGHKQIVKDARLLWASASKAIFGSHDAWWSDRAIEKASRSCSGFYETPQNFRRRCRERRRQSVLFEIPVNFHISALRDVLGGSRSEVLCYSK